MMTIAQQKSTCVLQFSKIKSVILEQWALQRRGGIAATNAKNICRFTQAI